MGTLEQKEKELLDYLDTLVHRVMMDQGQSAAMCSKREMRIIDILGKKELMIMTEVAEEAMLSLSTVTGIMDSLVEKSYARRERSEEDRRIVRVELTPEGRKLHRQSLEFRMKLVHGMLAPLTRSEQDDFIGLFRKIAEKIQAEKKAPVA